MDYNNNESNTGIPAAGSSGALDEMDAFLFGMYGVRRLMGEHFAATGIQMNSGSIRFETAVVRGDWKQTRREFRALGYRIFLRRFGSRNIITLVQIRRGSGPAQKRELRIAWILFICTIISTLAAGFSMTGGASSSTQHLIFDTMSFSIGLLLILGTHEMAHKFAALRNGVDASPPYFIPAPTFIGTFGAVIKIKSPMPDENAAVELGISGPLAGFLVAIPILIAGVMLSPHAPTATAKMPPGALMFGEPLLFKFIAYILLGIPTSHTIQAHPLAFAGWVGMLVTTINLFPIGQLDGGHITHALLGHKRHKLLSRALVIALVALGAATQYYGWFVWAALCFWINSRGYPQTYGGLPPLRTRNIVYGIIALIIFILCFTPAPIYIAK